MGVDFGGVKRIGRIVDMWHVEKPRLRPLDSIIYSLNSGSGSALTIVWSG